MVKKIPAMHNVFIALLEDPKERFPSTYNFRREADICELFLSRAIKGCCKGFITPQNMTPAFLLAGVRAFDLVWRCSSGCPL
jgi:hypothetical protein